VRAGGAQASRRPAERRAFRTRIPRPRHQGVARGVQRLHRGDHAERAEPRDVFRIDDADVLDPMARRLRALCGLRDRRVGVEREADRAVAGRVDRDLPALRIERRHHLLELGRRHGELAGVAAARAVGCEHGRGLRFHGAVEHNRRDSGFQQRIVGVAFGDRGEVVGGGAPGRHRGVDAQCERSRIARGVVEIEIARRGAEVLHARDSALLRVPDRELERLGAILPRRLRQHALGERHRRTLQQPGGLAPAVAHDRAEFRRRRPSGDARRRQRLRVQPERAAVLRQKLHGPVAHDRVELRARRQIREDVVRPAGARDPLGVRTRRGPGLDSLLDLVECLCAEQLHTVAREPAGDERRMRIVEPRNDRRSLRVDDGRLRPAVAHDLALAADLENFVAADGDGFRHRTAVVGGIDPGVVDDEIDGAAGVVAVRADDQSRDERRPDDGDDEESGKTRGHGPGRILSPAQALKA
jgi:hypothetical protein